MDKTLGHIKACEMRTVTILIILWIFHIFVINEVLLECQTTNQQVRVENYDGLTNEFHIWKGFMDSNLDCLKKCFFDFRCITYQYHLSTTKCLMYSADIDMLKQWQTDSEFGHVTYQLQKRGFGEDCMSDDECHFPNSECRQSTCGCIVGYSFNPMKGACTNGCATYSKSYAIFPETQFFGMDIDMIYTGSLQDCQKICSGMSNCKSFDYFQSGECYTKSGSVLDNPSNMHPGIPTHGIRNCYN